MRPQWEAPRALNCLCIGLASGLGPVFVVIVVGVFVRGEAFWLLPTLVLGAPASALAGVIAALMVYRVPATGTSLLLVWLLTAAGAFVLSAVLIYAEFHAVTGWVAAPLLSGAVVGALPVALLARVRSSERPVEDR